MVTSTVKRGSRYFPKEGEPLYATGMEDAGIHISVCDVCNSPGTLSSLGEDVYIG